MKIVFLITALDYSGGPKMMAWVANQFAKEGNKVTFISIYSNKIDQPLEKNVQFISLGLKKSDSRIIRNTIEMLKVEVLVSREINRINPDVVIGFLYSVDYFYTLFNCNRRRKIILSQRLDPYQERGISAKIKRRIIEKADGVVFQSFGARDYYDKKVKDKACVIPNPVTEKTLSFKKDIKPFSERRDIIVVPARLDIHQKRQDVMLDAFEIVAKEFTNVRLVLLGNGPDKERLNEIIKEKNLVGRASIHPAVSSAEEFTKDCKIVCLTSDYEGLPNSIIEALALGLDVVATDCSPGGAKMLIEDCINGYIVKRGDYLALADRICELLRKPDLADRVSLEARKISEKYSEENISKQWLRYVKKIVDK